MQGYSKRRVQTVYPIHPIGFPLLIYSYGDRSIHHLEGKKVVYDSRLNIAGQVRSDDLQIEINGKFGQVGLILSPTATYYLFHRPGSYFLNRWRNLSFIFPDHYHVIETELATAGSARQRISILFRLLQDCLEDRLPGIPWLDQSIADILGRNGNISIAELADRSEVGERHFRRKFKQVIGIPPKYFCKVIQLNTIFEWINSNNQARLHHLALDLGYFDQAHFIKDFNKLIGDSPQDFLHGKDAYVKEYLGRWER